MPPDDLLAVRQDLNLTKEALARLLGVGVSSIHRWEKGDSTGPSGPVLQFYRAARAALARGRTRQELLVGLGGDPGVVMARVFAMGFLEGTNATSR